MSSTRSSHSFQSLGGTISEEDAVLKGVKLPTIQVICCNKYFQEIQKMNQWNSATEVYKQVKVFYLKANSGDRIITDRAAISKLIRCMKKDNETRRKNLSRRNNPKFKQFMEKHAEYLNKTFLVTTADALVKPFEFEEDR